MKDKSSRQPIAIVFETSCKAACDRIAGALDYIARFTNWEPFLVQPHAMSPAKVRKALLDIRPKGVILQCKLPPGIYPANSLNVPVVTVDGFSWEWGFTPNIRLRLDEDAIGRTAAAFFHKRKFEFAAYVGTTLADEAVRSATRGKAFCRHFRKMGGDCRIHEPRDRGGNGRKYLADFLASLPRPCGVFTYSDSEAQTVVDICRKMNFAVPQQLSVLGVDNNEPLCETGDTATSSILPDFRGCGYSSAQSLHQLLEHRKRRAQKTITFGALKIIERKSTLDAGAAHWLTSHIRQFISDHLAEKISVSTLAAETGVSLRMMEKMFRSTMGHSIRDEIKAARMQAALDLLREKRRTIAEVAWASGFGTPVNFNILFKKRYGMSPSAWRGKNV